MSIVERFVTPDEIDATMAFFRRYWGEKHILGNDRTFLKWQMSPERSPTFAGAGLAALTHWDDGRLIGLIGIQTMPFNCNGEVADSAWLCNLLAAPDYLSQGIGLKLMTGVHRLPIAGIAAAGINLKVIPMYRAMRYHCLDALPRFIRIVNVDAAAALLLGESKHKVLSLPPPSAHSAASYRVEVASVVPQDWNAFWDAYTRRGYFGTHRDSDFIRWRYLDHPRLDYRLRVLRDSSGKLTGASVHRFEQIRDRDEKLLRLVEVLADDDDAWDALLADSERLALDAGVAFVDHYTSRPSAALTRRGWYEESEVEGIITPSLFQPLLPQTRRINMAIRLLGDTPWKSTPWRENLHVVKTDGDQDRPS